MLTPLILLVAALSIFWVRLRPQGEAGHGGAVLDRFERGRFARSVVLSRCESQPLVVLLVSHLRQENATAMRHRFREMRLRQIPATQLRLAWMARGLRRPDSRPGASAPLI